MPGVNQKDFEAMTMKAKFNMQEYSRVMGELDVEKAKSSKLAAENAALLEEVAALREQVPAPKAKGRKSKAMALKKQKKAHSAKVKKEKAAIAEAEEAEKERLRQEEHEKNIDIYINTTKAYQEVAKAFPLMTLKQALSYQREYVNADADGSGLIEANELCEVLKKCLGLDCDEMSQDLAISLIKDVDSDGSGALDFLETVTAGDNFIKGDYTVPKGLSQDVQEKLQKRQSKASEASANGNSKACTIS